MKREGTHVLGYKGKLAWQQERSWRTVADPASGRGGQIVRPLRSEGDDNPGSFLVLEPVRGIQSVDSCPVRRDTSQALYEPPWRSVGIGECKEVGSEDRRVPSRHQVSNEMQTAGLITAIKCDTLQP